MLGRLAKISSVAGALTAAWMTECDKFPDVQNIEDISPFFDENFSTRSAWDEAVDSSDFSQFETDEDLKDNKKNDDGSNGDESSFWS